MDAEVEAASAVATPLAPTVGEDANRAGNKVNPASSGGGGATRGMGSTMLSLPLRGDRMATRWWLAGVASYGVLVFAFVSSLISSAEVGQSTRDALFQIVGLGHNPNYILALLVLSGIVIAIVATAFVLRDVQHMRREEQDIEWLAKVGRSGIRLVMMPHGAREDFFYKNKSLDGDRFGKELDHWLGSSSHAEGAHVETLLDSRVQAASRAGSGGEGAVILPEELRLIAEKRTSAYGAIPRYASSLLLLFAVLGTFAGVKAALPGLISAVQATGTDMSQIADALRAVADAFGGNALALIGAIALGVMAQGIALGRRNLLERLELVSAEYVYRDEGVSNSNPLASAVAALDRTAREIRASNGALLGIEGGLEGLASEFKRSFAALEDRLASLADRHQSDLYDRTAQTLHSLNVQVAALTEAVHGNATVYQGLVDHVGQRAAESRDAALQLRMANTTLTDALAGVTSAVARADATLSTVESAATDLSGATSAIRQEVANLTSAVESTRPPLRQIDELMTHALGRMEQVDHKAAEMWKKTGADVANALEQVGKTAISARGSGATGGQQSDLAPLLRQISDEVRALRDSRPSPITSIVLPFACALAAGAVALLVR